jgi:ligand-binding SRPBCC domain-containing protein
MGNTWALLEAREALMRLGPSWKLGRVLGQYPQTGRSRLRIKLTQLSVVVRLKLLLRSRCF